MLLCPIRLKLQGHFNTLDEDAKLRWRATLIRLLNVYLRKYPDVCVCIRIYN